MCDWSSDVCSSDLAIDEEGVEAVGELVRRTPRLQPRVRPVHGRKGQEGGGRLVQIGPELSEVAALAEEGAEALLVAPALADDLLAPVALEVAPLAHEDRRDVELLRDDAQVAAQRATDLRSE